MASIRTFTAIVCFVGLISGSRANSSDAPSMLPTVAAPATALEQGNNTDAPSNVSSIVPSEVPSGAPSTSSSVARTQSPPTSSSSLSTPAVGCFSSRALVDVLGMGQVPMTKLQVGQHVMTRNGQYEPVYAFGHRNPQKTSNFLQIQTKAGILEVTAEHLVFLVGEPNPVRADSIQPGDVLQGTDESTLQPPTVTSISAIVREGLYNPLTPSGTIVVNGIIASTYISFQTTAYVELQGAVKTGLSYHDATHIVLAPFRVICTAGLPTKSHESLCNSYNEDGLPIYVALGIDVIQWGLTQKIAVQCIVFACSLLICGVILSVEYLSVARSINWLVLVGIMTCIVLSPKQESRPEATHHPYKYMSPSSHPVVQRLSRSLAARLPFAQRKRC